MMLRTFLCAALAVAATSSQAGDWYALGMVTRADANPSNSAFDNALTTAGATGLSSSSKDKSNKWRLQLGYRFNDYVALEGGYIDLGRTRYSATYNEGGATGQIKAGGPNLTVLGMLPVTKGLSLFGELGVIDAKVKSSLAAGGVAASDAYDKTQVRPIYGLGAMYQVSDNVDLRASYERVDNLGDKHRLGQMDVNLYSLGLDYRF